MLEDLQALIDEIRHSRKYHHLDLPESTLRDLLEKELPRHRTLGEALKVVRKKLHNIVAPYLGDPDYGAARLALEQAFASGGVEAIKSACSGILSAHASTRERLPIAGQFYAQLFALTGQPKSILDLACGLNPFFFPWMGLPLSTRYHAYDIHRPRVELINHYFTLQGLSPLASVQDILVQPPTLEGEVAFLFKEAHRLEQRQRGCNLPLWLSLNVRWLLVSLPPASLSGRHDLADKQRRLVYSLLENAPPDSPARSWRVTEIQFENELVFCIEMK